LSILAEIYTDTRGSEITTAEKADLRGQEFFTRGFVRTKTKIDYLACANETLKLSHVAFWVDNPIEDQFQHQ